MATEIVKALRRMDKPDMAYGYDGAYKWHTEDIGRDAAGLIEQQAKELDALREAGRWIPVGEGLPEPHVRVLIYKSTKTPGRKIHFGYYGYCGPNQAGWKDQYGNYANVTHWMPLPAAPEQKGE